MSSVSISFNIILKFTALGLKFDALTKWIFLLEYFGNSFYLINLLFTFLLTPAVEKSVSVKEYSVSVRKLQETKLTLISIR